MPGARSSVGPGMLGVAIGASVITYICHYCGYQGVDPDEEDLDRVLCAMCGEPAMERVED